MRSPKQIVSLLSLLLHKKRRIFRELRLNLTNLFLNNSYILSLLPGRKLAPPLPFCPFPFIQNTESMLQRDKYIYVAPLLELMTRHVKNSWSKTDCVFLLVMCGFF